MKKRYPTTCPIVYSMDIWGDPWSLVILRDILLDNKRYYREFLTSPEQIATNILSARLQSLMEAGLLIKIPGRTNRAQTVYRPTQKALDLIPVLLTVMQWGIKYNPNIDMAIPITQQVVADKDALQHDLLAKFKTEVHQ